MAAVIDIPRKVWTREEAHRLAELGFEHLELVEGELLDRRMGKNPSHSFWKDLIQAWLGTQFGPEYVRSQDPIDVSPEDNPTSEPEPDLVLQTRTNQETRGSAPRPDEIRLLIEVSDATLDYDLKRKSGLYARAGIAEYWVIDIPHKQVVIHRNPVQGSYEFVGTFSANEEVFPLTAPTKRFSLNQLERRA